MVKKQNCVIWIQRVYLYIYKDIAKDVETNYELDRPLPKIKNNKVIGLTKDKLCEKIMKEFARISNST